MRKKYIFLAFLIILLFFCFQREFYAYVFTKDAPMIERDKFKFSTGIFEYYRKNIGSVFKIPLVIHLGLAKRVEFIGIFPYLQLKNILDPDIATWGDILILLKFDMKKFVFQYPFILNYNVLNQIDMVLGFSTGTGISEAMPDGKYFTPHSVGLSDFRIGLLYSQIIKNFSLDFDFMYTFAQHIGEDYLPFNDTFWSTKDEIYIWGIVNVLVKYLWPAKYPFAAKEAEEWEKYPHLDDYFYFNAGLKYFLDPSWLLFSYDLFFETNWVNSWSKWSIYPSYLLFTPGIQIYLTETLSIIGGISYLVSEHVYQPDKKELDEPDKEFYFENLYFIGIKFLL